MTETLIELVRQHPCLYDKSDDSYKNLTMKTKLWKQIGKAINETGEVARTKWKSLRDNYMRYRKEVAGTTGQATKKFTKWPWSSQLHFLELTLSDGEISTNVRQFKRETSSPEPYSSRTPSPETLQPGTVLSETSLETTVTRSPSKKTKKADSDIEKVVNDLHNRKNQECDAIDHLFQSYAQTFKGFSKKKQIKAKVELAKLFASIETEELQENV